MIVRTVDLDTAVHVDDPVAVVVVAKRLDGQRPKMRLLVGDHRSDLTLRRAVDARVCPAFIPAIKIGLCVFERFKAERVKRALCVVDARLDLALAVRIADAAWQRDCAVVTKHVAIERIDRRVVDVGSDHSFFQVIEDDRLGDAPESAKRELVQLGPRLRARLPDEQSD